MSVQPALTRSHGDVAQLSLSIDTAKHLSNEKQIANRTRNLFTTHCSCYLVFGEQYVQCDVVLHAHLEVKAFPHATLARLRQLGRSDWLIVRRVEKLPQKLPVLVTRV